MGADVPIMGIRQTPQGKEYMSELCRVSYDPSDKISDLKRKIREKTGNMIPKFHIICNGEKAYNDNEDIPKIYDQRNYKIYLVESPIDLSEIFRATEVIANDFGASGVAHKRSATV